MPETQGDKLLSVSTALTRSDNDPGDPLLLSRVSGVEGISMPYAYELTMFTPVDRDIAPLARSLVGTAASFLIRAKKELSGKHHGTEQIDIKRSGIWESFERAGKQDEFILYRGLLVPPFKMLDHEVTYRAFEAKTVVEIIKAVVGKTFRINLGQLAAETFPVIEYCAQYGESSFNFLSRLMATYGIAYYFDHRADDGDAINGTMVLVRGLHMMQQCAWDEVTLSDDKTGPEIISGLTTRYRTGPDIVGALGANQLQPDKPFFNYTVAQKPRDNLGDTRLRQVHFGGAIEANAAAPDVILDDAETHSKIHLHREEAELVTVTGVGKNPTFAAGRSFQVKNEKKAYADRTNFLIRFLSFYAYDMRYGHSAGSDVWDFVKGLFKPFGSAKGSVDLATSLATQGLANYMQNEQQVAWQNAITAGRRHQGEIMFMPFAMGGIASGMTGVIPYLVSSLEDKLKEIGGRQDYANSFVALPMDGKTATLPLPQGRKPTARGPHLAVVLGPVDGDEAGPYADMLGRVRIQFPWIALKGFGPETNEPEWSTACWARVSDNWAGRRYGTQFLPRPGEEVVVDFLDADPERPVILGRAYNAETGPPNLPFPAEGTATHEIKSRELAYPQAHNGFQRSGIKTRSMHRPKGSKEGFHLLRFDDLHGKEQLLLRSQARMDVTALHDHHETVHGNRHLGVQGGKDANGNALGGGIFFTSSGEYNLHIGDIRYEKVEKDYNLQVGGKTVVSLNGLELVSKKAIKVNADELIFDIIHKITLKVGSSSIVINPIGVYIDAADPHTNAPKQPASFTPDPDIFDPSDASAADPGEPPDWLARQPKGGGGGGHHKHTLKIVGGQPVTRTGDGMFHVGKSKILIDGTDPDYAERTVNTLIDKYRQDPNFAATVDDINGTGQYVTFKKPDAPTNPPHASVQPNSTDAYNGKGSGSTVVWDPNNYPTPHDADKDLDWAADRSQANAHGANKPPPAPPPPAPKPPPPNDPRPPPTGVPTDPPPPPPPLPRPPPTGIPSDPFPQP